MEKSEKPSENMSAVSAQTLDQARRAMDNYLQFFQKSMSALPWGKTDLSEKIKGYAENNVATSFEFAQKLTKAKDFQDLVRIQTEFMQTQLKTLSEQAKNLSEIATKAATDTFKGSLGPSS
jgi:phasin family protein